MAKPKKEKKIKINKNINTHSPKTVNKNNKKLYIKSIKQVH